MKEDKCLEFRDWLLDNMEKFWGNPQVCRTFHECLQKFQSLVPEMPKAGHADLPEDRS